MNEELQKVLAELIGSTIEAKAFLLAELPDVIQQLLWWHGLKSGLSFVAAIAIAAIYARTVKWLFSGVGNKNHSFYKINGGWDDGDAIAMSLILSLPSLIPFVCFWSIDWLQILIAPKLYLIEYAAKLVG